jgi:hypothetical protein
MANSLLDSSNLSEWLRKIRFDFNGPDAFVYSVVDWLADAPASVLVIAAAITVAAFAFTGRPGATAIIVLITLSVLGAVGTIL